LNIGDQHIHSLQFIHQFRSLPVSQSWLPCHNSYPPTKLLWNPTILWCR